MATLVRTVAANFESSQKSRIPRDELDRIFDRFTQVEGSATRRYEGSGIGLALVKEIVTQHGGSIAVESESGHGSVFTILLPRGRATPGHIAELEEDETLIPVVVESGQEHTGEIISPDSDHQPLLLVADDNADMRRYLERVLSRQYRIVLAKDG